MQQVFNHSINRSSAVRHTAPLGSMCWCRQGMPGPAAAALRPQAPRFQRTQPRVIPWCTHGKLSVTGRACHSHSPSDPVPPLSQVPCRTFSAVRPKGSFAELLTNIFHPERSERCPMLCRQQDHACLTSIITILWTKQLLI